MFDLHTTDGLINANQKVEFGFLKTVKKEVWPLHVIHQLLLSAACLRHLASAGASAAHSSVLYAAVIK